MRKKLFNSLCFLVCSLLLLTGCEKDQLLPTDAEDGNKTENELPIRLNADDYDSDNTYYMLMMTNHQKYTSTETKEVSM